MSNHELRNHVFRISIVSHNYAISASLIMQELVISIFFCQNWLYRILLCPNFIEIIFFPCDPP